MVTIGELKLAIADMPDEWVVSAWNGTHEEAYWVELIDTSIHGRVEFNFDDGSACEVSADRIVNTDKYYTDEEIIETLEEELVNSVASDLLTNLVRERFSQKDKQHEYTKACLNEAANIIGHNTISESMIYE